MDLIEFTAVFLLQFIILQTQAMIYFHDDMKYPDIGVRFINQCQSILSSKDKRINFKFGYLDIIPKPIHRIETGVWNI